MTRRSQSTYLTLTLGMLLVAGLGCGSSSGGDEQTNRNLPGNQTDTGTSPSSDVQSSPDPGDDEDEPVEPAKLEGTVTLKDSESAAGVQITAGTLSTTTPGDGTFTLAGLQPGEVTVTAQKEGWEPTNQTVTLTPGATKSISITLSRDNLAPSIDSATVSPEEIRAGGTADVVVTASDPNGDELSYTYKATGGFAIQKSEETPSEAQVTAPDQSDAVGRIRVTVSDDGDQSAETTIDVRTTSNAAPVIQDLRATPPDVEPGGQSSLTAVANDPDGDELTYKWEAPNNWTLNRDDALQVRLTAPDTFETQADVTVTVTDDSGASDSATITIGTTANQKPSIRSVGASPPQASPGGTIQLGVDATDPEGKSLSFQWNAPQGWSLDTPNAQSTSLTAPSSYGETATVQVTVTDSEGAEATGRVAVSTPQNNGPRLLGLSAAPTTVERNGTIQATVSASDPNGDSLNYNWSISGNWSIQNDSGNTSKVTVMAPNQPGSTAVLEVVVDDGNGGSATATTTVSTEPNQTPSISGLAASSTSLDKGDTATISVTANDPDGDSLSYTWNVPSSWTQSGSGSQIDVTAPDQYGQSGVVKVTVSDGFGGSQTRQLVLTTIDNDPPSIRDLLISKTELQRNATVQAEVVASDPNGDQLTYSWAARGGSGWSAQKGQNNPAMATAQAPNVPEDQTVLEVIVTDEAGATATTSVTLKTLPNHPPAVSNPSGDIMIGDKVNPSPISPTRHWAFQMKASDVDGDSLSYKLTKKPTGAKIDKTGKITWKPTKKDAGTHTFEVRVSDGFDQVTRTLEIRVASFFLMKSNPLSDAGNTDGVAWADLDSDGHLDAVAVERRNNHSADIAVSMGTEDGFKKSKRYEGDDRAHYCVRPAIGDVDGNRTKDIVLVCDYGESQDGDDASWYVWLNDGKGNFKKGPKGYWNASDMHWIGEIDLGDLDLDGDLDLSVTGREQFIVAENDGNGNFDNHDRQHHNCFGGRQTEIAELDGGGRPEVVYTVRERCGTDTGRIQVYDVDRNVHFDGRIWRTNMGKRHERPNALGIRDLDGDKDRELVVADDERNQFFIYRNDGKGNFSKRVDTGLGSSPYHYRDANPVSFGDVDNDGHTDIVLATNKNRNIRVMFGNGKAEVREKHWVTLDTRFDGRDFSNVHVANWNADKSPDIFFSTQDGKLGIAH